MSSDSTPQIDAQTLKLLTNETLAALVRETRVALDSATDALNDSTRLVAQALRHAPLPPELQEMARILKTRQAEISERMDALRARADLYATELIRRGA